MGRSRCNALYSSAWKTSSIASPKSRSIRTARGRLGSKLPISSAFAPKRTISRTGGRGKPRSGSLQRQTRQRAPEAFRSPLYNPPAPLLIPCRRRDAQPCRGDCSGGAPRVHSVFSHPQKQRRSGPATYTTRGGFADVMPVSLARGRSEPPWSRTVATAGGSPQPQAPVAPQPCQKPLQDCREAYPGGVACR